jgi:hypothetical protein
MRLFRIFGDVDYHLSGARVTIFGVPPTVSLADKVQEEYDLLVEILNKFGGGLVYSSGDPWELETAPNETESQ